MPCTYTQFSYVVTCGGSQVAVYSTARAAKFSHHALDSFSLYISGWCSFINPCSRIELVFYSLAPSPKNKTLPFFGLKNNSKQTGMDATLGLTLDSLRAPGGGPAKSPTAPGIFTHSSLSVSCDCKHIPSMLLTWADFHWLKTKHWSSSTNQDWRNFGLPSSYL